jgi:hypothetical protein
VKIGETAYMVERSTGDLSALICRTKDEAIEIVKDLNNWTPRNSPHRVVRVRLVEIEAPEPERNEQ